MLVNNTNTSKKGEISKTNENIPGTRIKKFFQNGISQGDEKKR